MTNDQKQILERQLWNIANELRGRMDADEFQRCRVFVDLSADRMQFAEIAFDRS